MTLLIELVKKLLIKLLNLLTELHEVALVAHNVLHCRN